MAITEPKLFLSCQLFIYLSLFKVIYKQLKSLTNKYQQNMKSRVTKILKSDIILYIYRFHG